MKKKVKNYPKYAFGNLVVFLLGAASILSLFLPYVSGVERVIPVLYLAPGKFLSVFGIMFAGLILLPVGVILLLQIIPWDSIKKFLLTCCFSVLLLAGTVMTEVILIQGTDGQIGIGFPAGVAAAVLQIVSCIMFTRFSKVSKKHKDMVWYMGINKIFTLIGLPVASSMTLGIILFWDLVFHFPLITVLGILCIWLSVCVCTYVGIMSLFGKYSAGIFYYPVAFLSAVGIVALCWSSSIWVMIFGVVAASAAGMFCLSLGGLAKKYF